MIGFPCVPLSAPQLQESNGVAWTKGFGHHESKRLPSGLMLLIEDGFYSEGSRDLVRLTWFRLNGSRFKRVLAFEGTATLDGLPPIVQGNSVRLRTVDEPHAFLVAAADSTFGRDSTWRVEHGVPRLVNHKLLAQRLRAVDAEIWRSWSANHPSPLQKQIRKAWPEPDDLFSWTEKRNRAIWTVNVNRDYSFTLRRAPTGEWKVIGFRTTHKAG